MSHKLLLADDSVTIQRVIELTFADEDVEVLTAGDGEQAIASIQSERPDIVLADVGMPKRSGYDVAAFVKGAPELSHIPVLLLTGAFEPVDERRAQAAGCDGVLVKPFEPQHVIARVRELLQSVQGRSAARRGGSVTRAVSDVPRPAERLTPHRIQPAKPAAAGNGEESGPSAQESIRPGSDLDDYFDRLDAAFANMATPNDAHAPGQPDVMPRREGPVMERELDWFDTPSSQAGSTQQDSSSQPPSPVSSAPHVPPPEPSPQPAMIDVPWTPPAVADPVPATFASPPVAPSWTVPQFPSIEPPDSRSEIAPQTARPTRVHELAPPAAGSLIAEAFSALLAAEQGDAGAPVVRLPSAAAPPVTDELIDEIVRRVVDRLGSHAVQDLIADVVSRVAERLVREEIDRIRSKHS